MYQDPNNTALINARELALMAEERWLIENLKRTRTQRNALKVEALYYQGLKAALFTKHAANLCDTPVPFKSFTPDEIEFEPIPEPVSASTTHDVVNNVSTSVVSTNKAIPARKAKPSVLYHTIPSNIDDFDLMEQRCNELELQNLTVIPSNKPTMSMDIEYESEEEGEWDNVNLEMGMLVNGQWTNNEMESEFEE